MTNTGAKFARSAAFATVVSRIDQRHAPRSHAKKSPGRTSRTTSRPDALRRVRSRAVHAHISGAASARSAARPDRVSPPTGWGS
ncbi:MAG TPA: hypothetical protein VFY93_10940 [Planctomycetota bacterium]|nr:hypothetical protein [Planctomycetota bacterium]